MASYSFVTVWHIDAPLDAVWDAIYHVERWTGWWKGLAQVVKLEPGDQRGIGSVHQFTWKGRLPYTLTVEMRTIRVEPRAALESLASGALEGRGVWQLVPHDDGTMVRYEWNVRTTKLWMNVLAPLARPLFQWNHNVVMRWGEEGLKRLLENTWPGR